MPGDGASEPQRCREIEERIGALIGGSLYDGYSRGVVTLGLSAAEKVLKKLEEKESKMKDRQKPRSRGGKKP